MKTRETIALDARAQQRLIVWTHLAAGELDLVAAALALELSERQTRRLADRLATKGAACLVHGNRGRVPSNRIDEALRGRVVELATGTLAGFNPVHLSECLTEIDDPIEVSARTVRRILSGAGLRPPRTRRRTRSHDRRERMAAAGMLLAADGSTDDWLEDRGPRLTLVGGIDDATSTVTGATFRAAEDAAGYFSMLIDTIAAYGRPLALYTDRAGIFIKDTNRPPDPRRAVHRTAFAHSSWSSPPRCGHRLDRRSESPGQGPRRAAMGHPPGSSPLGTAPSQDRLGRWRK
jgi:hypothetical protein